MSETESANASRDPRTAEVLRALQRARGIVANAGPPHCAAVGARSLELPPRRDVPSNGDRPSRDLVETLASSVRFLETALVAATEKLSDFQRNQDRTARELRESVQGLKHQMDVLAGWRACRARRLAAWGVIITLLIAVVVALSWRAQEVALTTHAVLEQILENQARAQTAKSGKRR